MKLTEQQKKFFDTFGYLVLPGAMSDSVGWIIDEFESVFKSRADVVHDGSKRTMFPQSFIDSNAKLCTLLDDPRIVGVCEGLMGEDFLYEGGDGNFYSGDTGWHSDIMPTVGMYKASRHIKIAFYLDALTRDTGALRVIPGSHLAGDTFADTLQKEIWSLCDGKEMPSIALETKPGDLAIFHHNLKHASYGGSKRRRMFTMNLCAYPHTPQELAEIAAEMRWYGSQGAEKLHSETMLKTASPARMKHLQPLHDLFGAVLIEESAKAREKKRALQPA
ncbi:MAG TPA: phytanoyl-CoA dioxygenase family protein [Planctomycetota bacterium]|nr:phytanoyl-CoA dioxygenase family protein [Planctomycetota bacterium]